MGIKRCMSLIVLMLCTFFLSCTQVSDVKPAVKGFNPELDWTPAVMCKQDVLDDWETTGHISLKNKKGVDIPVSWMWCICYYNSYFEKEYNKVIEIIRKHSIPGLKVHNLTMTKEMAEKIGSLNSIESLSLEKVKFTRDILSHALQNRNIKQVELIDCGPVSDPVIEMLSELTGLKVLNLKKSSISSKSLIHLAQKTNLKVLSLSWLDCTYITDPVMKLLENFHGLQRLDLHSCKRISNNGLRSVARLKKLKVVTMNDCEKFTNTGLSYLNSMPCLETLKITDAEHISAIPLSLKNLVLNKCPSVTGEGLAQDLVYLNIKECTNINDKGLTDIGRITSLEKLILHDCTNVSLKGIQGLTQVCTLKHIEIKNSLNITDEVLKAFSKCKKLETLILDKCSKVTDKGIAWIGTISSLNHLVIPGCLNATDQGIESLMNCKKLERLDLDEWDGITDRSLILFERLPDLRYLCVTNCDKITEQGRKALQVKRKGLTVKGGLGGKFGGGRATESCALSALRWFRRHQAPDGSWSIHKYHTLCSVLPHCDHLDFDAEIYEKDNWDVLGTGFALLAFTGHQNSHKRGGFRDHIKKGIDYLKKAQKDDGSFSENNFIHAIASYALVENYGMTADPELKPYVQKAVDIIIKRQNKQGGWDYTSPSACSNTFVTAWNFWALRTARRTDLKTGKSLDRVKNFLDKIVPEIERGEGPKSVLKEHCARSFNFEKNMPGKRDRLSTAISLSCRIFAGYEDRQSDIMYAHANKTLEILDTDLKHANPYELYFGFLGAWGMTGGYWGKWSKKLKNPLWENQWKEGCMSGSWDPTDDPASQFGGRLITTAVLSLHFSFYYRYQYWGF
ncbi:prenyltransferase/squalene oxidase repeat-containing protein [Planctomycetota bacterium]